MADETSAPQPTPPRPRRSSFAGQTFADLFGTGRSPTVQRNISSGTAPPTPAYPGPITTAAAQAQQRRLSITTLGLAGSPSTPPFQSFRATRRDSETSAASGSVDESAIEDDAIREPSSAATSTPTTPFARRMSFGARALRDVRNSSGGGGAGQQNGTRSPPSASACKAPAPAPAPNGTISARDAKGRGSSEGFNWSENFRTRVERNSSIAGQGGGGGSGPPFISGHTRAKSVAIMEPTVREAVKEPQRPDHFQERILKGDFYMD